MSVDSADNLIPSATYLISSPSDTIIIPSETWEDTCHCNNSILVARLSLHYSTQELEDNLSRENKVISLPLETPSSWGYAFQKRRARLGVVVPLEWIGLGEADFVELGGRWLCFVGYSVFRGVLMRGKEMPWWCPYINWLLERERERGSGTLRACCLKLVT